MTTMPQQPIDSVQVPQAVGLSPEVAFNLVGQAGLAPTFQAQAAPGAPVPGVPSQWGQVPASFTGQAPVPGQPAAHVVAQNPLPGTWVPRGSIVYLEWAEVVPVVAPEEKEASSAGWIVAGILAALLVLAGLVWFLASGGDPDPEPSRSPSATATVTETPSPRPTRTVTETATSTQTATSTSTATATATATETSTVTAPPTP
jgi:hypothetical protein